ncbi:MAG: alanine--tRNA ligase [Thermaerobacter sp.]|nr:alanine--tRNA ligase [Thermaerobacter sp.]
MQSAEIRKAFLDYFKEHGHTVVESASLVPHGDATLLFTNAGMVQFKDVFLGREQRPYRRATTAQRCVRAGGKHNDLDQVGRTLRHHTFFEMLGNFSFGDYFKEDAIRFAYDFLTSRLGIPTEKLYFSVFREDDDAFRFWQEVAGVGPERVARFDEADNFWEMGDTGPCGPCSEIFYDRGAEYACGENCDFIHCACDRYLEIWNLVFMQYDRDASGKMTPLPRPSIDTGMGLERLASVLQGVESNWDTDLFQPLIQEIARLSGIPYDRGDAGFAFRVVADHLRAAAFLIADGVLPGNEGRSYVLRRITRRAVRIGQRLGLPTPFLPSLLPTLVAMLGEAYPEIAERMDSVRVALTAEEERFSQTLEEGGRVLEQQLGEAKGGVFSGHAAFLLYDTYGFPIDLTEEIVVQEGLRLDREGFEAALAAQRARARAARGRDQDELQRIAEGTASFGATEFTGYSRMEDEGEVLALFSGGARASYAGEGDEVRIVLSRTPFYGEGGGQVGDRGVLAAPAGRVEITDARKLPGGRILHLGQVVHGSISEGQRVGAEVDAQRRRATMRNHTATHLLHAALREVLGAHVRQAGSVVEPERLRFDFLHHEAMRPEEIRAVERRVQEQILRDTSVETRETSLGEARRSGAMALFEEKYGDTVRMVGIGEFSRELCGGTHVGRTGEIGPFKIVEETSVGSGIRRIVALTGLGALEHWQELDAALQPALDRLRTTPFGLSQRVEELQSELSAREAEIARLRQGSHADALKRLLATAEEAGGARLVAGEIQGADAAALRRVADMWRLQEKRGILCLASRLEGSVGLLCAVTPDLVSAGVRAGDILGKMASAAGGRGGGRPDLAQGGAKDPAKAPLALQAGKDAAREALG